MGAPFKSRQVPYFDTIPHLGEAEYSKGHSLEKKIEKYRSSAKWQGFTSDVAAMFFVQFYMGKHIAEYMLKILKMISFLPQHQIW